MRMAAYNSGSASLGMKPPESDALCTIPRLPLLCPSSPPIPLQQDKKAAEEAKQKELNDLFAITIKQPKLPLGATRGAFFNFIPPTHLGVFRPIC